MSGITSPLPSARAMRCVGDAARCSGLAVASRAELVNALARGPLSWEMLGARSSGLSSCEIWRASRRCGELRLIRVIGGRSVELWGSPGRCGELTPSSREVTGEGCCEGRLIHSRAVAITG